MMMIDFFLRGCNWAVVIIQIILLCPTTPKVRLSGCPFSGMVDFSP